MLKFYANSLSFDYRCGKMPSLKTVEIRLVISQQVTLADHEAPEIKLRLR